MNRREMNDASGRPTPACTLKPDNIFAEIQPKPIRKFQRVKISTYWWSCLHFFSKEGSVWSSEQRRYDDPHSLDITALDAMIRLRDFTFNSFCSSQHVCSNQYQCSDGQSKMYNSKFWTTALKNYFDCKCVF